MEKRKKTKETTISIVIFLIVIVLYAVIGVHIEKVYISTNNLMFYFIKLMLLTTPYWLILFATLYSKNKFKFIIKGLLILTLVWGITECFYMPKIYNYIRINGKEPSMAKYKFAILRDVIENKTTRITISDEDITESEDTVYTGGRHRRKTKRTYMSFEKDNKEYVSESSSSLNRVISSVKRRSGLIDGGIEITIEYYNNSGIIKEIEGVSIHNYEAISDKLDLLLKPKIEEKTQKKIEAEKLKKEEEERRRKKKSDFYKIKQEAVGKKIESVEKELKENGTSEYSIKYISSKLYSVGRVVFVDKFESCFYVVKDNKKEDMVKMPVLEPETPKEEVMEILSNKGLKGEVSGTYKTYKKEKSGTLATYTYSAGTLLPKGLEVGFSIYE